MSLLLQVNDDIESERSTPGSGDDYEDDGSYDKVKVQEGQTLSGGFEVSHYNFTTYHVLETSLLLDRNKVLNTRKRHTHEYVCFNK